MKFRKQNLHLFTWKRLTSLIMNIHLAQELDGALPRLSFVCPHEITSVHFPSPTRAN